MPSCHFGDSGKQVCMNEQLTKVFAGRRRVFSRTDDKLLATLVTSGHFTSWTEIAQQMDDKTPRQCRERWLNYLAPSNSFEPFTEEEDKFIVEKINEIGRKWSQISRVVTGRSENSLKNHWYSSLRHVCFVGPNGKYILVKSWRDAKLKQKKKRNAESSSMSLGAKGSSRGPVQESEWIIQEDTQDMWHTAIDHQIQEMNEGPFFESCDLLSEWSG